MLKKIALDGRRKGEISTQAINAMLKNTEQSERRFVRECRLFLLKI